MNIDPKITRHLVVFQQKAVPTRSYTNACVTYERSMGESPSVFPSGTVSLAAH